ncbi:MAG: AbrB/MazE/SpoVT family DNA-binding domain-containing protein [Pseudomonadota bacterium]|nr:AbrB/MazE/SpoVT family DNA-binding domain-containing protein [Pseudomonadota bacterium]
MQVSRWGNSLAIRIPASVVDALSLQEGDDIEVRVPQPRVFEIVRQPGAEEWLARIRHLRGQLPPDFRFDREDAHGR